MDGIHDMGGMHGFGSVDTTDEESFHHEWERTIFGIDRVLKSIGLYNIDEKRHAIERLDPETYVSSTYFERWLHAVETLLAEKTDLDPADHAISTRHSSIEPIEPTEIKSQVKETLYTPTTFDQEPQTPKFSPGDTVKVTNKTPSGHTRCPRYLRRATGTIHDDHGTFTFPDENAHGTPNAEPLYSVAFSASELWGDTESSSHVVYVDLWESYLNKSS